MVRVVRVPGASAERYDPPLFVRWHGATVEHRYFRVLVHENLGQVLFHRFPKQPDRRQELHRVQGLPAYHEDKMVTQRSFQGPQIPAGWRYGEVHARDRGTNRLT